jgi:hypothetical protein
LLVQVVQFRSFINLEFQVLKAVIFWNKTLVLKTIGITNWNVVSNLQKSKNLFEKSVYIRKKI